MPFDDYVGLRNYTFKNSLMTGWAIVHLAHPAKLTLIMISTHDYVITLLKTL